MATSTAVATTPEKEDHFWSILKAYAVVGIVGGVVSGALTIGSNYLTIHDDLRSLKLTAETHTVLLREVSTGLKDLQAVVAKQATEQAYKQGLTEGRLEALRPK